MSKTLLIDLNSWGHAANHGAALSANGIQTQAVFGVINGITDAKGKFPNHEILALWDSKAQFRFDIYPEYKGTRSDTPEKIESRAHYDAQKPFIKRALESLGINQMTAEGYEADDLAGHFVASLSKNPANEIVLASGDQDWLQLVRPNLLWYDKRDDSRRVTIDNFQDYTGCLTPYQFLESKALQGDTSDNIKGVGGIGAKGAPEFLAEFGTVLKFWNKVDSGEYIPTRKPYIKLASDEGRGIFKRNFRLMNLLSVKPPSKSQVNLSRGKFDIEKFMDVCAELSFVSMLNKIEMYREVFG